MASALGHIIDIPILVRTLAIDYHQSSICSQSSFTDDMRHIRQILDAGPAPQSANCAIAKFALSWWLDDKSPEWNNFLNADTLMLCLEYHRSQRKNDTSDRFPKPAGFTLPSYTWHWSAMADSAQPSHCTRCRLYRSLALGTWSKLRDLRSFVHAARSQFSADVIVATRRASGLNEMFEKAVVKDTSADSDVGSEDISRLIAVADAGQSRPRSSRKKGKSRQVQESEKVKGWRLVSEGRLATAQKDTLPASKWTWGVDLTEADLKEMVHGADRGFILPHSGYDESLEDDQTWSKYSSLPDIDKLVKDGDAPFLPLSSDITHVPDLLPDEFPIDFCLPPLRRVGHSEVPSGFQRHRGVTEVSAEPEPALLSAPTWFPPPPVNYVQLPEQQGLSCQFSILLVFDDFQYILRACRSGLMYPVFRHPILMRACRLGFMYLALLGPIPMFQWWLLQSPRVWRMSLWTCLIWSQGCKSPTMKHHRNMGRTMPLLQWICTRMMMIQLASKMTCQMRRLVHQQQLRL